jgi:hypothetical protein
MKILKDYGLQLKLSPDDIDELKRRNQSIKRKRR